MSSRLQLSAAIFGALALLILTAPAQAAGLQAQMQEQADRAALAGVNLLGTGSADGPARRQEAIDATRRALDAGPGVTQEVTASVEALTITVKLSSTTFHVVSTARYLAADQPAEWAWASRQHFAADRNPVVLGSNCGRGCRATHMR
jgi:hypothetical protein